MKKIVFVAILSLFCLGLSLVDASQQQQQQPQRTTFLRNSKTSIEFEEENTNTNDVDTNKSRQFSSTSPIFSFPYLFSARLYQHTKSKFTPELEKLHQQQEHRKMRDFTRDLSDQEIMMVALAALAVLACLGCCCCCDTSTCQNIICCWAAWEICFDGQCPNIPGVNDSLC